MVFIHRLIYENLLRTRKALYAYYHNNAYFYNNNYFYNRFKITLVWGCWLWGKKSTGNVAKPIIRMFYNCKSEMRSNYRPAVCCDVDHMYNDNSIVLCVYLLEPTLQNVCPMLFLITNSTKLLVNVI